MPTSEDKLFVDPECVRYSEVELQQTPVDVIVQDKTQTLYARSSSGFFGVEITYLTSSTILSIYLFK